MYKKGILQKKNCEIECNNGIHLKFMLELINMVDFGRTSILFKK